MHNINCVRGGGFTHVLLYQNCIKKCEEGGGGGGGTQRLLYQNRTKKC